MVFVGPQASGKSTVSKLLYFFDELWNEIVFPKDEIFRLFASGKSDKIDYDKFVSYIESWISKTFDDIFGNLDNNFSKSGSVAFEYDTLNSLSLSFSDKLQIRFSENLKNEISVKAKSAISKASSHGISNAENYLNSLDNELTETNREILFIPTGRSIATVIANQLHNLEFKHVDHLTRSFVKKIINARLSFNKGVNAFIDDNKTVDGKYNTALLHKFIEDIVKAEYVFEFENEKLLLNNGKAVSLNFASSGQQEALWIVLFCLEFILKNKKANLYIEEPEAHLYPESQKNMMDLIAMFFNSSNNRVFITTHSPYILGSINNLLYADSVGNKHPVEVNQRIRKEFWLNHHNVAAYLVNDGLLTDIMDKDLHLIQNEVIDSIAGKINEDFDALFDLENN